LSWLTDGRADGTHPQSVNFEPSLEGFRRLRSRCTALHKSERGLLKLEIAPFAARRQHPLSMEQLFTFAFGQLTKS